MILFDTTVLVYTTGGDHRFREPCRNLVTAVGDGALAASTTVEVIQEFAYVRARRTSRTLAAQLAGEIMTMLSPLVVVTEAHVLAGLTLWKRHDSLGSFDAVLAATAIDLGCTLVSADQAFSSVRGLDSVVPDYDGVARLLDH